MKSGFRIILATAIITAIVVVIKVTKHNTERRLSKIADEGYETANDILYPEQKLAYGRRLHYGPVLPL